MSDFIDYDLILSDFKAVLDNASLTTGGLPVTVLIDAMDRDFVIENMPLIDLRVKKLDPQATTNRTYYSDLTIEAEICTFDLTNRREAAKLRNDLTNALQRFVKDNPRFSLPIETTTVGQVNFLTGESKAEGAFVAGAVCEFHPTIYSE